MKNWREADYDIDPDTDTEGVWAPLGMSERLASSTPALALRPSALQRRASTAIPGSTPQRAHDDLPRAPGRFPVNDWRRVR